MVQRRQRPTEQQYIAAIQQLQVQNHQLAQMVMAERAKNAQRGGRSSGNSGQGTLGAYNQLWGGGNAKSNQESYNGSAFSTIHGRKR